MNRYICHYHLKNNPMNDHLFTQIPVTSTAKTATIKFDGDDFAKINLEPVKFPCKYYNLVFLAMEQWIDTEWDPGEKQLMTALSSEFSKLIRLMEDQLDSERMEAVIKESPLLTPFTVKLDYNFTL